MTRWPTTKDEARAGRYRQWAGSPQGVPYREDCCAAEVEDGRGGCLPHQCGKNPGHGPGNLYCRQHARRALRILGEAP